MASFERLTGGRSVVAADCAPLKVRVMTSASAGSDV